MRYSLSALLGATLFICPALAGDLEDLKAAQDRYEAAFETRNFEAIATSLAEEYIDFAPDRDEPEDWREKPRAERVRYFRELLAPYERWEPRLEGARYRVVGETGIVTGTERLARKSSGGVLEYPRRRFTMTWVKKDGRWLLASAHRSAMPASAPGALPLAADDGEARLLKTALDGPRWANVPLPDARLLRVLAELAGAKHVVELGSSTGFSGLWISNALRKTGGRLTTFEFDPGRAAVAREQFRRAGVEKIATLVQGDAHVNIAQLSGPIDMVFIDAEKDGYPDYLRRLLPLVRPGGVILGHNVRWPAPNQEFIRAITRDPALETIFLNMDDQGVSVTLKKR